MLIADGHPLLQEAAQAILPAARNAAAHEDFEWDERLEVLRVGESEVTIDELEDATTRAYAFMCGAEAAWTCARAQWPQLATLLDEQDPPHGLKVINERGAIAHFGSNGLHVTHWCYERGVFAVTLENLPFNKIYPCFQALIWASRYMADMTQIQVHVHDHPTAAINVSREALDATFLVWMQARTCFRTMPPSTFLPANVDARLHVELPADAALAASWLALNDAVHAYNEAHEGDDSAARRLTQLALNLDLIASSLSATISILPLQSVGPLRDALNLVLPAATWAGKGARGENCGPSAKLEDSLRTLYEKWPIPAILPTLDTRPLDLIDHQADGG